MIQTEKISTLQLELAHRHPNFFLFTQDLLNNPLMVLNVPLDQMTPDLAHLTVSRKSMYYLQFPVHEHNLFSPHDVIIPDLDTLDLNNGRRVIQAVLKNGQREIAVTIRELSESEKQSAPLTILAKRVTSLPM